MDLLSSIGRVCSALAFVPALIVLPAIARAQNDDITIAIAKHAELLPTGR